MEDNNLIIPEEYKKMSLEELTIEKEKLLTKLLEERTQKSKENNCPKKRFQS